MAYNVLWHEFVARVQIVLNFRTAYFDANNELVTSRLTIARSYVTGWFTIDLLSVLPFELILTSRSLGLVRLLKGARVRYVGYDAA